jgi:hypothetical protein
MPQLAQTFKINGRCNTIIAFSGSFWMPFVAAFSMITLRVLHISISACIRPRVRRQLCDDIISGKADIVDLNRQSLSWRAKR